MDKSKIGLPKGFSINVGPVVELGDYLDETAARNTTSKPLNHTSIAPVKQRDEPNPAASQSVAEGFKEPAKSPIQQAAKPKRKPRRQINMNSATQKKFNEIITHVQDFSPQNDAAASEIMEAIISAHHDALTKLRFGSVRPRGRWGDPTAEAFKHALSQSFIEAIVEFYNNSSVRTKKRTA